MSQASIILFSTNLSLWKLKEEIGLNELSFVNDEPGPEYLTLHRTSSAIWVYSDPTILEYMEDDEFQVAKKALGAPPTSAFVIEQSRSELGDILVKEFLQAIPPKFKWVIETENEIWESWEKSL